MIPVTCPSRFSLFALTIIHNGRLATSGRLRILETTKFDPFQ